MKNENYIRIPSISTSALNEQELSSLTLEYINDNTDAVCSAISLFQVLDKLVETDCSDLTRVKNLVENFETEDALFFFSNINVAEMALELLKDTPACKVQQKLSLSCPVLNLFDASHEFTETHIERATNFATRELYPLYSKPCKEEIKHFIEKCPNVAFAIVDNNYFAYLTCSGQLMAAEIAYAYLVIDGCIPHNIADKNTDFSSLCPSGQLEVAEFFA
ncbi:hypothetical protein [Psychromonas sp. SP041]|uniref:hypothetical protein n=1 Tax=Psychromonas sp. SP041 TaxID=1365007 RepID=UPI00040FAAE7|nr:hypothetical protein [Psychromonas sp. SP041]